MEVEMLYRLFLHREPESEAVIQDLLQLNSFEELCGNFLHSNEFKERFERQYAPFDWPHVSIETTVDADRLSQLVKHVELTWSALGMADPHWSVISRPEFRRDSFPANVQAFRESGRIDVERLHAFADRAGIALSQFACCLELGCGVGRTTQWLAQVFPRVLAMDISPTHLSILKQDVKSEAVEPILLSSINDIDKLPDFDVFFSLIVLQHNPPPVISTMLHKILSKLRVNGIGYFQVPTYNADYSFNVQEYLANLPVTGEMEMHVLPQEAIFNILKSSSCDVIEIREDGYTGDPRGLSMTFFIQKTA